MLQSYREDLAERMKFSDSDYREPDDEEFSDYLTLTNMHVLGSQVIDYAEQDAFAATLKAMIIAYDSSLNAYLAKDRMISQKDFEVFAKAFANVAMAGLKEAYRD